MYNWVNGGMYRAISQVYHGTRQHHPKKKCDITKMLVSKHSQQNPDGSDMFLAVSSVQLILI